MADVTTLLRNRVTLVWVGLVIATLIAWAVGTDDGFAAKLSTSIVLVVAFIKVRFIGVWFMELRDAPRSLRWIFEGYCVVVGAALITMYLAS